MLECQLLASLFTFGTCYLLVAMNGTLVTVSYVTLTVLLHILATKVATGKLCPCIVYVCKYLTSSL